MKDRKYANRMQDLAHASFRWSFLPGGLLTILVYLTFPVQGTNGYVVLLVAMVATVCSYPFVLCCFFLRLPRAVVFGTDFVELSFFLRNPLRYHLNDLLEIRSQPSAGMKGRILLYMADSRKVTLYFDYMKLRKLKSLLEGHGVMFV